MKTVLIILGIWIFISFIHEIATGGENLRAFIDPLKRYCFSKRKRIIWKDMNIQ